MMPMYLYITQADVLGRGGENLKFPCAVQTLKIRLARETMYISTVHFLSCVQMV